jgi:hypothetical protein
MLSPTQMESKHSACSARSDRSSISAAVVTPKVTPRFGSVRPNDTGLSPISRVSSFSEAVCLIRDLLWPRSRLRHPSEAHARGEADRTVVRTASA